MSAEDLEESKLETWLTHVLKILDSDAYFNDYFGDIVDSPGLAEWWEEKKADQAIKETLDRKAKALAKLTREERILLGLEKPPQLGVMTAQAGIMGSKIWP